MESGFKKILCNLFGITARSYSNWSKEDRAIVSFFEKGYISKNEIEEFLKSNKIKKLELIKDLSVEEIEAKLSNIGNYDRDQRTQEMILLLQKKSTKDLLNALNYCFDKYDMNNRWNYDKFAIIEKIRNLLQGQSHDDLIKDLNEKLGFDFNINDIQILEHFMMRYKVYDTLYGINNDEAIKK